MANLKYTIVWLVFLLAHLDLELVQCFSYTVKSCPPSLSSDCPPRPVNSCSNDQDCEASYPGEGLKCCKDCGRSCVSPEVSVVEVTPAKIFKKLKILTKLVERCPIPFKRHMTEIDNNECWWYYHKECDLKYPGQGLKCCRDGNYFRCSPPLVVSVKLPMYCPRPLPPRPGECDGKYFQDICFNDEDCEKEYPALKSFIKCCVNNCISHKCMIPIQGKEPPAGIFDKTILNKVFDTCPIMPTPAECPPKPHDECIDDSDCNPNRYASKRICCKDGCDFRCVPPVTPTVNGTCPIFPFPDECPPEVDDECNKDVHCYHLHPGFGLKCCRIECNLRCLSPIV